MGGIETIALVPTEWNPQLFFSGLTDALSAHPGSQLYLCTDPTLPSRRSRRRWKLADRWAPTGEDNHMWLATSDLLSSAIEPMEQGYIDVSTTWDALSHARETVRVAIALVNGEDPGCGDAGCLAQGRVVTPGTIADTENLWSRDYQ